MATDRKYPVLEVDRAIENADWTKQSWDLGIDNVPDLLAFLESTGTTVEEFKQLPVYKLNVDKLPWLKEL